MNMKAVTVTMGPQVRKVASIRLANMALEACGTDRMKAEMYVEDPQAIYDALVWTVGQIATLKAKPDCPHGDDDEAIATDILDGLAELEAKGD
jgi:hypothetical protein